MYESYRQHLIRGLAIAVFVHLVALGVYQTVSALRAEEQGAAADVYTVEPQEAFPLPDGPPLAAEPVPATPAPAVGGPSRTGSARLDSATAAPAPARTPLSRRYVPRPQAAPRPAVRIERIVPRQPPKPRPERPPPDFVAVERMPVPVRQVRPHYPSIARGARVEGRVIVKAWVDRTGRVRKVEVLKSDSALLDQAALDAVAQWTFSPATQNGHPVDIWVSIPVQFRLR